MSTSPDNLEDKLEQLRRVRAEQAEEEHARQKRRAERVSLRLLKLMFSGQPLPPGMMELIAKFAEEPIERAHETEDALHYWSARGLKV